MNSEDKRACFFLIVGAFIGGMISVTLFYGSMKSSGAADYRAQLDADCKLVGFHRIGENVYICKDVKADHTQAAVQQNQTVEGK